jgi:hypothetical protein
MILKKMGWGEKLPAEEKLLLWEVSKLIVLKCFADLTRNRRSNLR